MSLKGVHSGKWNHWSRGLNGVPPSPKEFMSPQNLRNSGSSRKNPPQEPPEEPSPAHTLLSDFCLQNWAGISVSFKPSRAWSFVTAVPAP